MDFQDSDGGFDSEEVDDTQSDEDSYPKEANVDKVLAGNSSKEPSVDDTKLAVKMDTNSGKWKVTKLEKEHNHENVTPSKSWYLRSQRTLSVVDKGFLQIASNAHMGPAVTTNLLTHAAGGPSHVAYNVNQYSDYMRKYKKSRLSLNDVEAAHAYCQRMTFEDPEFSYTIQTDNEGRMTNFFWVDGKAKLAYKYFGDVIVFDTTYRKNKYQIPFAPFTGVNHHRKNILFGCALLMDEIESTFTWLFQTWLEAMSGRPPVSIITDQDAAMKGAIRKVFPNVCYRFCLWHIMKKFPEYFSDIYRKDNLFKIDLHRCLHKTYSEEEFELHWKELVRKHRIEDHSHAKLMYSIRKQWVPTFLRGSFFTGMQSSQRSESTNRMLGRVLKPSTTLQEFIQYYNEIQDKRYEEQNHNDFVDINKFPAMRTNFPIEKNASKIYTKEIFKKFQEQIV